MLPSYRIISMQIEFGKLVLISEKSLVFLFEKKHVSEKSDRLKFVPV